MNISKITTPLKPVRLENGDGQNLQLCPKCFGVGTFVKAVRSIETNGAVKSEAIFCKEADIKRLKK